MPTYTDTTPVPEADLARLTTAGDGLLRTEQDSRWAAIVSQTDRLGTDQDKIARTLDADLFRRVKYRRDGMGITQRSEKDTGVAIRRAAEASSDGFQRRVERQVSLSTQAAARGIASRLGEAGLVPPTRSAMQRIARDIAQDTTPFFGKTVDERVAFVRAKTEERLWSKVREQLGGPQRTALERQQALRVEAGKVMTLGTGGPNLEGGSTRRDMERILVAEAMRKVVKTDEAVMRHVGVKFVYWRLSPAHPRYRKLEVCEAHAMRVDASLVGDLRTAGFDPTKLDLHGLWRIDDLPDYPHAFCKCWREPLILTPELEPGGELERVKKDPSAPADPSARGELGREAAKTLSMGIADAQLAQATAITQSLNALATSAGLRGIAFSTADLATLGTAGAAQMLALRIAAEGPEAVARARSGLAELIVEHLPAQQDKLAELRDRRDGLLAQIDRDRERILSETTSTRLREKAQADYTREVAKSLANVEAVMHLDAALGDFGGPITTLSATSEGEIRRRMAAYGLTRDNYRVRKVGQSYDAVIDNPIDMLPAMDRATRQVEASRRIKDAIQPGGNRADAETQMLGTREILPGGFRFTLDRNAAMPPAQQAGLRFIEEREGVLLHFAPGLGKTPTVVASVSTLAAKGKIERAIISPPASVRQQMVVEALKFNAEGTISYYVPASLRGVSLKSIRSELLGDYESSYPIGKKARLLGEDKLTPAELADYRKLQADATAYADAGMARLKVVGLPSRGADATFRRNMEGSGGADLFHIMGHDDLARVRKVAGDLVDYVAIDEVHQMTNPGMGKGSAKSSVLTDLNGTRLRYKVGLTGTAVRNNLGEAYDIMRWIDPAGLPPKDEYIRLFSNLTLESDTFLASSQKLLRTETDSRIMTVGSPVEADLRSGFSDRISAKEREKYITRLEMSPRQLRRAAEIEGQYNGFKEAQRAAKDAGTLDGMRQRRRDAAKELDSTIAKTLGMSIGAYQSHLQEYGVPPPPRPGFSVSPAERATIRALRGEVETLTRVVSPESWRDTAHHSNVHGGDWQKNAKAKEVVRLMTTPESEGGFKGKPTLIHLERFESIEMLTTALEAQGLRVADYHGGLGPTERAGRVSAMNDGQLDVLILTRAGSTGLNVQKASASTIHFDLPYTFAEVEQRDARNWRNGQQNEVTSYSLVQQDMYTDRRRLELVQQKKAVLRSIDEMSRVDDLTNPLTVLDVASERPLQSYEALVEDLGRAGAETFLTDLCSELVGLGATTRMSCPVRPARVKRSSLRSSPVLGEVAAEARKKLYAEQGDLDDES